MSQEKYLPTNLETPEKIQSYLKTKEATILEQFSSGRLGKYVRAFSLLTMIAIAESQGNQAHAAEKAEEPTSATQFFNLEKGGAQGVGKQFTIQEKSMPAGVKVERSDVKSGNVVMEKPQNKESNEFKTQSGYTIDAYGNAQRKSIGENK